MGHLRSSIRKFLLDRRTLLTDVTDKKKIAQFLNSVRPVKTNHDLVRIGGETDGGYLVPNILDEIKYLFSPGVSNQTSFDEDCYKKKITPFLLDFTIYYNNQFNFIKKNLNTFSDDNNITLRDWLNSVNLAENENNLMLQMDIEGNEWDILDNIELSLLKKFKIIVIEFHFFKQFIKNLQKISNVFKK